MIVFEGIDGSGKTTQAKRLAGVLSLPYVKFPDYERLPAIKEFLEGSRKLKEESAFLLFLADIMEGTPAGDAIIDRYVFSTIAYAVDIPLENAMQVIELLPFRKPRLTVYFDVEPAKGLERKAMQGVKFSIRERESYLEEVRERYLRMAEKGFFSERWEVVDASLSLQEVEEKVDSLLD